jgi:hypothetical protein
MAKAQNPKGGGKWLPGRNGEREAKKGLNSQPNQTTTQRSRKTRWRSHKEHGLERSSTYHWPEGLLTGEASSPPEGEHRCSGEGHVGRITRIDIHPKDVEFLNCPIRFWQKGTYAPPQDEARGLNIHDGKWAFGPIWLIN